MNIIVNISMLGSCPTGLGVYAERCASLLEQAFRVTLVASSYTSRYGSEVIPSPPSVAIGAGKFAAFKRIHYALMGFSKISGLIYTPTHHGVFLRSNQIVTVHDLISLHHPRQHPFQYFYFKYLLPGILRRCRAIFTISQNAKDDIVDYYGIAPENIHIVPNGFDLTVLMPPAKPVDTAKGYLLVVGASYRHKNIEELLENWEQWKGRYTVKIVSCRGKHRLHIESLVARYGLQSDVQFLGYVAGEDLVALYQNCAALVFPSLWEGFGRPPLEAMACGRPVIVSDIAVHKEIMRDVPLYITPGDSGSWQRAFALLQDDAAVVRRIDQGLKLVQEYSWERAGAKLMEALLKVEPELIKSRKITPGGA